MDIIPSCTWDLGNKASETSIGVPDSLQFFSACISLLTES